MTNPAPESRADDFETMLEDREEPAAPAPMTRLDAWWLRAQSTTLGRRLWNWGAPAIVVLVAAVTRLWNLGSPHSLVFDETFYVKDSWTLWNLGYSASWPAEADTSFNAGDTDIFLSDPSFVVHPPLAKWIIGAGMALFGADDSVGWRISTALVGILAVVLLMVIAKKLFDSTLLAIIAGGLFAIEGNAIVMSRVALLDNYVMFFALLGFGAVLLDRAWAERRLTLWLAARTAAGKGTDWGPSLWWRPWLLAAGLAFGLTSAVKWSGFYFLAAFAVYTLVVDALARRRSGVFFWGSGTLLKQAPVSFLLTVPIAAAAHLSTWISWFTTDNGYYRHWAEEAGNAWTGMLSWVPLSWQSWWHFQTSVYAYHVGETRPHSYQANPLTWLFMVRPTSMFYQSSAMGENGCAATTCGESITGIANPLIWWAATAAILYLVYRLARYREWKVGLILMGMVAGYVPWLMYLHRTVFQFYTIAFEPYMILGLTLVIGLILGDRTKDPGRRTRGIVIVGVFLAVAVALSVYFWPLWTGMQLDARWIAARWWLPTWR
ncbi:dolichyl-phosphate-mannose--protein O-mannosyl transferase [Conyzicola lurida]|uniref:Polyprenol-phosphate-mannose--protein mannosyltransferase n=1 Tax=Conyzicola lurida TaxID=1172621 RepID=A0A841AL75_9MICO|nr:dolichyl-phosphate-mannose--protein O-mannosyl transferase [Conyzicola lurida]